MFHAWVKSVRETRDPATDVRPGSHVGVVHTMRFNYPYWSILTDASSNDTPGPHGQK